MGVEQRVSKKLKPLTIFLSDDELVNFKSHFDEFLNMNCDDKIKEQQEEIERLNNIIEEYKNANEYHQNIIHELETMKQPNQLYSENVKLRSENKRLNNIIKEAREYVESNKQYAELEDYGKNGEYYIDEIGLLEILDKGSDEISK